MSYICLVEKHLYIRISKTCKCKDNITDCLVEKHLYIRISRTCKCKDNITGIANGISVLSWRTSM